MEETEKFEYSSHTEHALNMLSGILEKITIEITSSDCKKQDYYNELASCAVYIARNIYEMENNVVLQNQENDEDEPLSIEFVQV